MTQVHEVSDAPLEFKYIDTLLRNKTPLALSETASKKIQACRDYLDKRIRESDSPIYGINTGFGSLYKKNISQQDLNQLQVNLVRSHACGTGDEVPEEVVRLMLFFKIRSLAYGHSGVQLATVQRLIDFYNADVLPVVYQQGSLGASGDLAPLAHLSMPLIGEGEVMHKGKRRAAAEICQEMGWEPITFQAKEGLALLNGTQFMTAYGVWCIFQSQRLLDLSNTIGALSLDAFDGRLDPFHEAIHRIRPQKGQVVTARKFRKLLEGSELISRPKKHVQDPYSFRCIPQVHGASHDALHHVASILHTELNAVTDNPNIFPEEDLILSGGNFHGQPLALSLDFLAMAVAELGNISERRTYQLISGNRELPEFLVANPGLNSGLMIPQYTAASIVSQNKQLCSPASVDSIVSSNGQEDHVSMGANAATKCYRVVQNVFTVLSIELITAAQALEIRNEGKTSPVLEKFVRNFRQCVSFIEDDRFLHEDIMKSAAFLKNYNA